MKAIQKLWFKGRMRENEKARQRYSQLTANFHSEDWTRLEGMVAPYEKSEKMALVLWFFAWWVAAHRFYLEDTSAACVLTLAYWASIVAMIALVGLVALPALWLLDFLDTREAVQQYNLELRINAAESLSATKHEDEDIAMASSFEEA